MTNITRRQALAGLSAGFLATGAQAQERYPSRAVQIVLSWAPGGSSDTVTRLLAQGLGTVLNGNFVVDNRPGAGGTIGHAYVARAKPDGYTLLVATNSTYAIAPYLYESIPYDGNTAFTPISLLATNGQILCVHPSVPANTVAEFIALAKAKPDTIPYASSGIGATSHLAAELLMSMGGITLVHVPYRGGAEPVQALISGQVMMNFMDASTAKPLIESGAIKGLGVSTPQRSPLLPQVPTIMESGLPGFESSTDFALMAPAGLPAPLVETLYDASRKALALPATADRLKNMGMTVISGTPAEFGPYAAKENAKWSSIIRERGIKAS
ncbi:tripartite tricarboxylate transporter substrate binding protein [Acetobacteraceae bacterium H6797]|nr:tripartite tricarboxylate transporter substrate binding protein [Acetobacteraceae bacterium H6797]